MTCKYALHLRNTSASKRELYMRALRADIIIPVWEKILSTGQSWQARRPREQRVVVIEGSWRWVCPCEILHQLLDRQLHCWWQTDICAVVVLMYYELVLMELVMLLSGSGGTGLCVYSYWLVHMQHQKCCWLHGMVVGSILLTPPAAFLWFDTISQGPNEKFKDMSRTNTQGQGRGQIFEDN